MVRRLRLGMAVLSAALAAVAVGVGTAAPSGAATREVTSELKYVSGLLRATDVDCDPNTYYVCGIGTFDGRPAVGRVEYPTNQRLLLDEGCALYDTVEVVTLLDGSGSLTLQHTDALVCGPNPNWLLHASSQSFGNPFTVESTWTVSPGTGTGVYAGASGSGTWSVRRWAGGAGYGTHAGTISTP